MCWLSQLVTKLSGMYEEPPEFRDQKNTARVVTVCVMGRTVKTVDDELQ